MELRNGKSTTCVWSLRKRTLACSRSKTYASLFHPKWEQRAIASALDAVGEAIEAGRAERDSLEEMKESAAEALLSGRLRLMTPREKDHD